jgi:hypothetical protein
MARFLNFSTFFKSFILDCVYLDHNTRYWSTILRQVHGGVLVEHGGARKLREGNIGGSYMACLLRRVYLVSGDKSLVQVGPPSSCGDIGLR